MDTNPSPVDQAAVPRLGTDVEPRDRIAWEAEGIAQARADIAAGRVVDAAKVDAWIDSLDTEHELPVPYSDR